MSRIDRLFSSISLANRLHVRLRILTAPFDKLHLLLPRQGRFLDLGGGHGALAWYLHFKSPKRSFTIIDPDPRKIAIGTAIARENPSMVYRLGDLNSISSCDLMPFSDILISDVLYLLSDEDRRQFFRKCRETLSQNQARLWVKDAAAGSGFKSLWDYFQERLAHLLRMTYSQGICRPLSTAVMLNDLTNAGFAVSQTWIDSGYPHAHILYAARLVPDGLRPSK